jgi:hypothetical protein
MEAITGGECSFKAMVFEGETGEEEWTRHRVSAGKMEKAITGGGGSGIRGKKTTPEVGQAGLKAKTDRKT